MLNINEKIYFWSDIMSDHVDFLLMNLSSREVEFIEKAKYFKNQFIEVHKASTTSLDNDFINKVITLLIEFIDFKRQVIQKLLMCDIELGLTPTFINHMINEALEFYNDLQKGLNKVPINPVCENINLHRIWLLDASGHAASIISSLDRVEKQEIEIAEQYKKDFDNLFIKAEELGQILGRTKLSNGALHHLNEQVISKITDFIYFLGRLKELASQCQLLSILKPAILDHMIREEQYYLANIQSINV